MKALLKRFDSVEETLGKLAAAHLHGHDDLGDDHHDNHHDDLENDHLHGHDNSKLHHYKTMKCVLYIVYTL